MNAPTDTMFNTAACGLAFRCGSASCTRNTGPRRFTSKDFVNASTVNCPERLGQRVGGVVHQDVDAAELRHRARDQRTEVVDLTEVGRHPDRLAAQTPQMLCGLLAGVGLATGHHDPRAGQHITLGQRQADPAGAAGDDDGPACHVEQPVE